MKNIFKKENRIVLIVGIFCLIFIGAIINYTFSFFAVEQTNSSIIAGEAESMKLDLTVVEKSSTNNGKLIPQLDEYITSAVIGRNGSCIDDNNNTVCQVYKITLKNSGSSSVYVNGEVVIDNKDNPNLKWAILNNTDANVLTAPVLSGNIKTPEETVLTSNELFTAGQTKNYFIVVWISEKGQTQIDSGNFTGVVNFNNNENNAVTSLDTLTRLGLSDELNETELTTFTSASTDSDSGIYATEDDLGTSYYFRGNVTNNYVKFGKDASNQDMYWRIVRINGDGTVRIVYDGTELYTNNSTEKDGWVGGKYSSCPSTDVRFVGYMYGADGATTYEEMHANININRAKYILEGDETNEYEGWYKINIIDTGYHNYVADAIYCNDRTLTSDSTTFATYQRNMASTTATPTLKCARVNDRFTLENSNIVPLDGVGTNQKLKYPIALLTADELTFAGYYGVYSGDSNTNSYLYLNGNFYTMSPYDTLPIMGIDGHFHAPPDGTMVCQNMMHLLRIVISLKPDALIYNSATSNGSITFPFVVE